MMYPKCTPNCYQCISLTSTACKTCANGYYLQTDQTCRALGQYQDDKGNQKFCSPKCLECTNKSDNCSLCQYSNQTPPSCNCTDPQQYIDLMYSCKNCNYKCGSCIGDSLQCTSCSDINRVLPNCDCNYDYEEVNQQCVKRIVSCDSQCKSCSNNSPSNCISCSQNRINPPLCECGEGFESQPDNSCIACQQSTYYDQSTKKCLQCKIGCKSCTSSICLECMNTTLSVKQNECVCSNQQIINQDVKGNIVCLNKMGVSVQLTYKFNSYFIVFTFDQQLQIIDFIENPLKLILNIYLAEVLQQYYEFTNPSIIKNQLLVKIFIKQTIKASQLIVSFLITQLFVSYSGEYVLDNIYLNVPLVFDIGPYLFKEGEVNINSLDQLSEQVSQFRDSNEDIFAILIQFQFIFYILNTLQPTVMFFLINARFPPNLYKFYQLIAQMAFPQVSDYMSNSFKTSFSVLWFQINQNEVSYPQFGRYKYLGMCTSLLMNNLIMLIKYTILMLVIFWQNLISFLKIENSNKNFKNNKNKSQKVLTLAIQKLNSENEINLMIVCICIFVEMTNINQEQYLSRMGVYFSLILILIQLALLKFNLRNIFSTDPIKKQYSQLFLDRISDEPFQNNSPSSKWMKGYFLIQLLKKYLIIIIVYFLYNFPIYLCCLCGLIFICSMILSITLKPYKTRFNRWIKILGELIMSVLWFLHIGIVLIEQETFQTEKDDQKYQSRRSEYYIQIANMIIILLIIFNLLYLINKFYDIIQLIKNWLKNRHSQRETSNKQLMKKNNDRFIQSFQKSLNKYR